MTITVIKNGYTIEQVLFGSVTEQTKRDVEALNNNPLMSTEWTYEEVYCNKSVYELCEFLGIS